MPEVPREDGLWEKVSQPNQIPSIREEDIKNYYLFGKNPLTGGKKNCQRHFNRAIKFGQEQKYIGEISVYFPSESVYVVFKAKVRPSMRKGLYNCVLTLSKDTGMVILASCDCKVGALGVCAHVGGVLFRLVNLKNPCTSNLCTWNCPPLSKSIQPQKIFDINWWPGKSNPAKPWPYVYKAATCSDQNDAHVFREQLLDGLAEVNPLCALYRHHRRTHINIDPFLNTFTSPCVVDDTVSLEAEWVQDLITDFVEDLVVSADLSSLVERATRGQGYNPNWKLVRNHLITASNFGTVVKRKVTTKPENLVALLCGYKKVCKTRAMMYGNKYESKARKEYMKQHMKECCNKVTIKIPGVIVSTTWPYLGASLDGIVTCPKHGTGAVEIKCPMKYRYR